MTDSGEIACILAETAAGQLLLPNVAVAEVLRAQKVRPSDELPHWCPGQIMWRGIILPLLAFELANHGGDETTARVDGGVGVLVMNRTRNLGDLSFYGLLVQGTPRLLRVSADDLEPQESESAGSAELFRVRLGEDLAIIPRLAYLEELVIQHRLAPAVR